MLMYVTCVCNSARYKYADVCNSARYKYAEAKFLNVEGLGNGGKHGFVSTSSDHRIYLALQEVGSG
jgi:hypothetical protein